VFNANDTVTNRLAGLDSDSPLTLSASTRQCGRRAVVVGGGVATALTAAQRPVVTNLAVDGGTIRVAWQDRSATETGFLVQWSAVGTP